MNFDFNIMQKISLYMHGLLFKMGFDKFIGNIILTVLIGVLCIICVSVKHEKTFWIRMILSSCLLISFMYTNFSIISLDKCEKYIEYKEESVQELKLLSYLLTNETNGELFGDLTGMKKSIYGEISNNNVFKFKAEHADGYAYFDQIYYNKENFKHYPKNTHTPKLIIKTYKANSNYIYNDNYNKTINLALKTILDSRDLSNYTIMDYMVYAPENTILY